MRVAGLLGPSGDSLTFGISLKVPEHIPRYYFSSFDSAITSVIMRPSLIPF